MVPDIELALASGNNALPCHDMNLKFALRKAANSATRCVPASWMRAWLKSCWYQPDLQDRLRFHVQPYRYDSAIPTRFDLDLERLKKPRHLHGLKFAPEAFRPLLDELFPYAAEIQAFPLEENREREFWFRNGSYEDFDAVLLYCMVRHLRPRRIIEAGCGFSSRLISLAARKNREEGHPVECTFIEPYPTDRVLRDKLAGPIVEKKIEDVPLEVFQKLQPGDFFCIDTSHVVKAQNDCCYEYLEIVPVLRPGVILHIHDIFTPYDYPEDWLLQKFFAYNEQYLLECLLVNSRDFEVMLPVFYLWKEHWPVLARFFPGRPETMRPGAFWMKKKDAAG